MVELNGPGSSDKVNIYAGGQRIARDEWDNITFEHTNPITGSRVNSAGHSSYRSTSREERDSFAADIPISNPYDTVASNGGTVTGDLFAQGALKGTVHLTPHRTINRQPTAREIADAQNRYTYVAIHETFHLARQGGYDDFQLAFAAYSLAKMKVPDDIDRNDFLTWSDRFDNFLKQHCRNDTTPILKKR